MNTQLLPTDPPGDIIRLNGHAYQPTPDAAPFQALTPLNRVAKTGAGVALFLGWLLLFIMGMSLESSEYSKSLMEKNYHINWSNLLVYGLLFTPTNGAILASLAGILGGIASNLAADNKFRRSPFDATDSRSDDFQSYLYMTESPLVSMLRGFVTYLIFVAGSYLTNFTSSADTSEPSQFLGLTASAYFKFAVSISLLAYLAGYDPSRVKSLINSFNLTRKEPDPLPPGNFTARVHETDIKINGNVPAHAPKPGGRKTR